MSTVLRRHLGTLFATGAVVATAAIGVPLAASAASPGSPATAPSTTAPGSANTSAKLAQAKKRCLEAVDRRTRATDGGLAKVHEATNVDEKIRNELASQLTKVNETLAGSKSTIESADSREALRAACTDMVTGTRVFKLYGPKTHAVVATSRLADADQWLERLEAHADTLWQRAASRGVPDDKIVNAKAHLADATEQVQQAHTHIDGLAEKLLGVTTSQVNDHSADALLHDARDRLRAARDNASAARADVEAIRDDLRTR